MSIDLDDYRCEICGGPCKNILFATFLCDKQECIDKAMEARGGPGGHMKRKAEGKPIIPDGFDEAIETNKRV